MPTPTLSRLQQVAIRDVWPTEPQDFTPWLASPENLPLLGEAVGLRLELHSTEQPVGDFRADIVCKTIPGGISSSSRTSSPKPTTPIWARS